MPKDKIVYKLVRVLGNGHRVSACAYGKYQIKYVKGRVIEAEGIGVMAFDTIKNARAFLYDVLLPYRTQGGGPKYEIITLKTKGRQYKPRFYTMIYRTICLDNYYHLLKNKKIRNEYSTRPPHTGTVCYKKVQVLT